MNAAVIHVHPAGPVVAGGLQGEHTDAIRAVLVREETRAGAVAEVYGRLTGRPAVATKPSKGGMAPGNAPTTVLKLV
mgnify:CR=1 FL=1